MFLHQFRYALKTLFKNKILLFWTFVFPLILATLFQMAFHDIENNEGFQTVDIAVVENEEWEQNGLQSLLTSLENQNLFHISYVEESVAQELLENNEITGYLLFQDTIQVIVKENGIYQTILKHVAEEILDMKNIVSSTSDIEKWSYEIYSDIVSLEQTVELVDKTSANMHYTMIEFYTLIAMTCLYGGTLGLYIINQNLANQSANGKRIALSPIPKRKTIMSSALAAYLVQIIGITLLFLYTIFILHVDYGNHFFFIILLTLVGCFSGLSLGIFITCMLKTNENTKIGTIIAVTMLGCFLSGMMGITMKYIIDKNIPVVNLINPASMITDGFYALYYYSTFNRYYFDLISLFLFSVLMIGLSITLLRRQQYDSI